MTDYLGFKNLSRKLVSIYVIGFVINLYLILYACVQIFDVTGILRAPVETKQALIPVSTAT